MNLYDILGVSKNASTQEIRQSYKKLALQYHPDKNPSGHEQFKHIARAYETLSDPSSRHVYDAYGDIGLQAFDQWRDVPMIQLLVSPVGVLLIIVGIITLYGLLVTQPILIGRHADPPSEVHGSWWLTFLPLWLFDALFCTGLCLLVPLSPVLRGSSHTANPPGTKLGCTDRLTMCLTWAQFLSIVVFQALVINSLDNVTEPLYSWWVAFAPYLAFELICLGGVVENCREAVNQKTQLPLPSVNPTGSASSSTSTQIPNIPTLGPKHYTTIVVLCIIKHSASWICRVAFGLLMPYQLSLQPLERMSWALVFAPVFVLGFGKYIYAMVNQHWNSKLAPTAEEEHQHNIAFWVVGVVGGIVCILQGSSLLMIVQRFTAIDSGYPEDAYRFSVIFIPLYVTLGLLGCVLFCFCCTACGLMFGLNHATTVQNDQNNMQPHMSNSHQANSPAQPESAPLVGGDYDDDLD
eukprot:TRINITY_DN66577_c8_g3_i1.p1 TRINITY_DN66577_c8_g3~~TRINITY_DN66577_c8_g3_i1.p1  ORF type:complete len:464 (+),score=20.15 TRINITY_DN66577_c8_g3_i1:53-1444(+)